MTRYLPDTEITVVGTFTDAGSPADPDSVSFEWRMNQGDIKTATPTNPSVGTYNAVITPEEPGILAYRWKGTANPKSSSQGYLIIDEGWFADQGTQRDYA